MNNLKASWIWFRPQAEKNIFARGRKTFKIKEVPAKALLKITTSGYYKLWINQQYIGRGPASASPARKKYDEHEVSQALKKR